MRDIIIIGAGPAGLTAALYALRSGRSVLLLEKENFGGQIASSPKIENFPSIKQISGTELADNLFNQVMDQGADFELEDVKSLTKVGDTFIVVTNYNTYEAKSVIIANGVKHKRLPIKDADKFNGQGVSYCAVCDGAFYKGQEVALVGDANTALQYALLLSNYCPKVTLLTLFDRFFGDEALIRQVKAKQNIVWVKEVCVTGYVGEEELSGVIYVDKLKVQHTLSTPALFVAIGQVPDNKIFANLVTLDKEGYIVAGEDCKTSLSGLFVAGDTRTKSVRQLTTSTADGAISALGASSYIGELECR
ncbi:MAG: FAD-dependent oxidoreductase [Clostridia bacterium]